MKQEFSLDASGLDHFFLESLHSYNIDLNSRELYLFGEEDMAEDLEEPGVEFSMSNRLIRNIRTLDNINHDPILIHMKSCGGDCVEGMAIYDAIRFSKSHITILSYTHARSMSSIILQSADRRVVMPNSYFMYHWGEWSMSGEYQTVKSNMDFEKRMEKVILDIYADRMTDTKGSGHYKKSRKKVKRMLRDRMDKKNDVFLTSDECVEQGFADYVFAGDWDGLTSA